MKYNLLFCVLSVFIVASPAIAGEVPLRAITVTGEAEEKVAPDQAVLSGQLVNRAKKLEDAKKANDALANKVAQVAKEYKIPEKNIAASQVYISPEYVWNQARNRQEQVGYIVSRNLSLTIDKLEIHERVLSALVAQGVDQINGVNFTLANPQARVDKLRVQAVQIARGRAQLLAEAAGAKLGKVMNIAVGGGNPMPVPMMARTMAVSEDMAEKSVAPSLPGVTHLQETVSVTFELE